MPRIQWDAKGSKGEGEVFGNNEGKRPGLVLIQEYWGLNDHVRDIAGRFAKEGFVVLAVDLFHGAVTKDAGEAGKLMRGLDWTKVLAETTSAVRTLRTHPSCNGKVAITGFCLGGAVTLATACSAPVSAAVPFYGMPDPKFADYSKITGPVLAHVAKKDGWVKPQAMDEIKKKVEAAGQSMEICLYDEDHAFFNDTRPEVYGAESAKLAWERTLAFLRKNTS